MVDPLDRKVLEQDQPQYLQSTQGARIQRARKEQAEYDVTQKQYESDLAKYEQEQKMAEEQYQKELAEYNKQLAEYNKQQEPINRRNAIQKQYDDKISEIEEQKRDAINNMQTYKMVVVFKNGQRTAEKRPLSNQEKKDKKAAINKHYNRIIDSTKKEMGEKLGAISFQIAYPNTPVPREVQKRYESAIRSREGITLTQLYRQYLYNQEATLRARKETSIQQAQSAAIKQREQYSLMPPIGGTYYLKEGAKRAIAVKPTQMPSGTIFPKMPMQAQKTRPTMINVDTGQSIMGGQKASPEITITRTESFREKPSSPVQVREVTRIIPSKQASAGAPLLANPKAKLAGLVKPVPVEGSYVKPIQGKEGFRSVYSFQNISDVKDPSAITLLQFQEQLKTQTAPSAAIYQGILEEKGLQVTPLSKRIIEAYSSKPVKEYKSMAEAFGLEEARGKKGIISSPLGAKLFDLQTGEGSVRIGKLLGYQYSKPQLVTELGEGMQGPPAPLYMIPDAFGEPRTDKSGNIIYVRSEKAVQRLSDNLAEKPSKFVMQTLKGPVELKVEPPKKSALGLEIERGFTQFEKDLQWLQKNPKSKNLLLATYQTIAPIGLAAGKSIGSMMAFGVNYAEQTYAPFIAEKLGLKPLKKVAPIQVSDTSGVIVLPVNFEKLDISKPETYRSSLLNPLGKEYQTRQAEYVKKYGPLEYASGIVFDYGGLRGGTQLIRSSGKAITKPVAIIRQVSKSGKQVLVTAGKKGISIPAKSWDITAETRIIKGQKNKPQLYGKITTQKPEPNPFGKERTVPYNIQQAQQKITGRLEAMKLSSAKIAGKAKKVIRSDISFPNRSLIEGRNKPFPNITRPAPPEYSKSLESIRIGLEVKKSAIAKKLAEMESVYRKPIAPEIPSYSRTRTSIGFGIRMKGKGFSRGISAIGQKIPELKTPKGIIKAKKQLIFIGKRTSKGIEKRKQKLYKSIIGLKPKITSPYFPQKTSLEIAKFKQKEKLSDTLARMKKITTIEEKPKVVVPKYGKNFLSRLKSGIGVQEPWDFKSIIRRPKLREEFQSNIRGSSIGKIKGTTSRKEFARLLIEEKKRRGLYNLSNITTKAGLGTKELSVRDLIAQGISKESRVAKIRDVTKLRFPTQIKTRVGFGRKIPSVKEFVKEGLLKQKRFEELQRRERFSAPFTKAGLGVKEKTVKDLIGEGLFKQKRFEELQRRERFSAPFTKAGLGVKEKTVKDLIGEGISKESRVAKIRDVTKLKAPSQTIKPIFPVPRKPTELENILQGFKEQKPKGQIYKRVRIDKYIPKTPKEWESWKGVGIVTAAGTLSMLGIGGEQKVEALPFAQVGKIALREVESGGQILIYPESKGISKPSLVRPLLKERKETEREEENILVKPIKTLSVMPEISFKVSQPQRVEEPFKMATVQMPRISVLQKQITPQKIVAVQAQKYRQAPQQRQRQIYLIKQVTKPKQSSKVAPKLAAPLTPKAPTRLAQPIKFKTPTKQIYRYQYPAPPRPPRLIGGAILPKENKIPKSVLKKQKENADFLGASSEISISGIFGKRSEITYGQKKIARLLKGDIRVVKGLSRTPKSKKSKKVKFF